MTPEQQRIAIAEACGWRMVRSDFPDKSWIKPDATYGGIGVSALPNYLEDLNAMQEAEKVLGLKYDQWTRELRGVCERERRCVESATARQRAEAFLKTLYLWKD